MENNYTSVYSEKKSEVMVINNALKLRPLGYEFSEKYRKGIWDGYISLLHNGKFLTGLLNIVLFYLDFDNISYKIIDKRIDPCKEIIPIDFKGVELRDYQWEAIASAVDQKRGVIGAATNAGKTLIAIGLTKCLNVNTLFLTHREELFIQTIKSFEDTLKQDVGVIWKNKVDTDKKVTLAMVQSMSYKLGQKRKDKEGNQTIIKPDSNVAQYLKTVEMVIVDEAHHTTASTYENILLKCCNSFYRIGLSGTPHFDDQVNQMKFWGLLGDTIFTIKNKDLIIAGHSSTPNIVFRAVKSRINVHGYELIYRYGIEQNKERNDIIVNEVKSFISCNITTLIIVQNISHGDYIKNYFLENGVPEQAVEFVSGKEKNRHKFLDNFSKGKLPVLISTLIVQEGISMESVGALIFALGGKSDIRVLQCFGRALRKNTFGNLVEVRDFMDYSSSVLLEHSFERYNIYIKDGLKEYIIKETL